MSGNPIAMVSGLKTLEILSRPGVFEKAEHAATQTVKMLTAWARGIGYPFQSASLGTMWGSFFTDTPVVDYGTAKTADTARYAGFFHGMLANGVYLAPSQFEAAFTSIMHDETVLGQVTAALTRMKV